jgi:hypothetical protein
MSEATKIWRGVQRSSRNPVVGMTTAIVSRNPLISHCAVVVWEMKVDGQVAQRDARIVSLRIMTKAETTSIPITRVACGLPTSGRTRRLWRWWHRPWRVFTDRGTGLPHRRGGRLDAHGRCRSSSPRARPEPSQSADQPGACADSQLTSDSRHDRMFVHCRTLAPPFVLLTLDSAPTPGRRGLSCF